MHDPIYISNWQLHKTITNNWAWSDDAFSVAELDNIVDLGNSLPGHAATTAKKSRSSLADVRSCQVSWISPDMQQSHWLFQRLTDQVTMANDRYFGFDIIEIETLQYTRYDEVNDHYTWHQDMLPHMTGSLIRKLSFILLLSDPGDHDGGEIELWFDNEPTRVPARRGRIIYFPSYVLHRVTPITRGHRRSLVGWIKGPKWK